ALRAASGTRKRGERESSAKRAPTGQQPARPELASARSATAAGRWRVVAGGRDAGRPPEHPRRGEDAEKGPQGRFYTTGGCVPTAVSAEGGSAATIHGRAGAKESYASAPAGRRRGTGSPLGPVRDPGGGPPSAGRRLRAPRGGVAGGIMPVRSSSSRGTRVRKAYTTCGSKCLPLWARISVSACVNDHASL